MKLLDTFSLNTTWERESEIQCYVDPNSKHKVWLAVMLRSNSSFAFYFQEFWEDSETIKKLDEMTELRKLVKKITCVREKNKRRLEFKKEKKSAVN